MIQGALCLLGQAETLFKPDFPNALLLCLISSGECIQSPKKPSMDPQTGHYYTGGFTWAAARKHADDTGDRVVVMGYGDSQAELDALAGKLIGSN